MCRIPKKRIVVCRPRVGVESRLCARNWHSPSPLMRLEIATNKNIMYQSVTKGFCTVLQVRVLSDFLPRELWIEHCARSMLSEYCAVHWNSEGAQGTSHCKKCSPVCVTWWCKCSNVSTCTRVVCELISLTEINCVLSSTIDHLVVTSRVKAKERKKKLKQAMLMHSDFCEPSPLLLDGHSARALCRMGAIGSYITGWEKKLYKKGPLIAQEKRAHVHAGAKTHYTDFSGTTQRLHRSSGKFFFLLKPTSWQLSGANRTEYLVQSCTFRRLFSLIWRQLNVALFEVKCRFRRDSALAQTSISQFDWTTSMSQVVSYMCVDNVFQTTQNVLLMN